MNLKTSYIILAVLFACCSIGFFFFRERILFFIYGYEQSLIKANTAESFTAFKKIVLGKKIFLAISIFLSFSCFVASYFVRKKKLFEFNGQLLLIILYVSLLVLILLLIVFALSFIIPKRIF